MVLYYELLNFVLFPVLFIRISEAIQIKHSSKSIELKHIGADVEKSIVISLVEEALQRARRRKIKSFLQRSSMRSSALQPLANQSIMRKRISTVRTKETP